ncbi:MAG: hypothetical protein AB2747_17630 [Candidatus Thiodiazotropha taylori]
MDLGGIGSMVGGVVGGMFGGPIGAQIGSMIGGQIGQMLSQMIGQFGQQNVAGGLANCVQQDAANVANQHVDNCGMPQFIKDEMKQFIQDWMQDCMRSIPSDCQNACNSVYDAATTQPESSNNSDSCTRSSGGSDISVDDADMNACQANNELDEEEGKSDGKSGGGNWLVELAKALAKIQTKFLDAAMENLATMEKNASAMDSASEEGAEGTGGAGGANTANANDGTSSVDDQSTNGDADPNSASRGDFMKAQSEFQANFQMFNMMANMTATSLKSLGEGLTSIARKQ